jgi:hypothetical protein
MSCIFTFFFHWYIAEVQSPTRRHQHWKFGVYFFAFLAISTLRARRITLYKNQSVLYKMLAKNLETLFNLQSRYKK